MGTGAVAVGPVGAPAAHAYEQPAGHEPGWRSGHACGSPAEHGPGSPVEHAYEQPVEPAPGSGLLIEPWNAAFEQPEPVYELHSAAKHGPSWRVAQQRALQQRSDWLPSPS